MGSSVDQYVVLALFCFAFTTQTYGQTIAWDSTCGSTKGCFPDCSSGDCEYLVTWQDTGSNLVFNLKAKESATNMYLAIAFSDDYRMGDDSVVGCIVPSSGTGTVYSYFNEGTDTEELSPITLGLSGTSVSQTNGVIDCSFTRDYTNSDSKFFDLNDKFYIQLVLGEAEDSELGHHYVIPWFSDEKVDFNSHYIVGEYKLNSPAVKLHGIMMVLAWLLFSLIGIITARYNKDMLPEQKLFGTKVWFQVHRGLMIAVVVCFVIGFIPIFVEIEGYSQIPAPQDESFSVSHPVLGIIITVLTFLNPIAAMLRPGPDHKFRWLFNWGHLAVGVSSNFLAILTIFFGYVLDRSKMNAAPYIVTGIQLFFVAVFVVALEINKFLGNKNKGSVDISMNSKADLTSTGDEEKKKPETGKGESKMAFIALIVFSVLMFGFAIALLGIIAAG